MAKVSRVEQAQRAIEARAFKRAAALIASGEMIYSCNAVNWNTGRDKDFAWTPDAALAERYFDAFQFNMLTFDSEPDPRLARLLALDFAREMVLTGDL